MEFHGEPLNGINAMREALRSGKHPDLARAWEDMRQSTPFQMSQRDVANLMVLVTRTNDLVKALEAGLTPTEWYQNFERGKGIDR